MESEAKGKENVFPIGFAEVLVGADAVCVITSLRGIRLCGLLFLSVDRDETIRC